MSKDNFNPSDVNIHNYLCGSNFRKSEFETIATNIIIVSIESGDKWFDFSWEDYKKLCSHQVTTLELDFLNQMVEKGFLNFKEGKFSVNSTFKEIIKEFVN